MVDEALPDLGAPLLDVLRALLDPRRAAAVAALDVAQIGVRNQSWAHEHDTRAAVSADHVLDYIINLSQLGVCEPSVVGGDALREGPAGGRNFTYAVGTGLPVLENRVRDVAAPALWVSAVLDADVLVIPPHALAANQVLIPVGAAIDEERAVLKLRAGS